MESLLGNPKKSHRNTKEMPKRFHRNLSFNAVAAGSSAAVAAVAAVAAAE